MATTIVLDDLEICECPGMGAYKAKLFEEGGTLAAVVIIPEKVLSLAILRAIKAKEDRDGRESNIVAFPLPLSHADTA